jgi:hypothetical protein
MGGTGSIRTPSRPLSVTSSGAFASGGGHTPPSGAHSAYTNPASRELRLLKTQLALAVGQREEDPERAWLEALSVREKLAAVEAVAGGDPLFAANVERFREKLETDIRKLTGEMGDEVLGPLYSWMDLLKQRAGLDCNVETARARVEEARAARGALSAPCPSEEQGVVSALHAAEVELAWWRREAPPPPPPNAVGSWTRSGGDSLQSELPSDPLTIAADGHAARPVVEAARARPLGEVRYAASTLEVVLSACLAFCAIASLLLARSASWQSRRLDTVALVAVALFLVGLAASIASRRHGSAERRAGIAWVWHYKHFTEHAAALELEVGWLRALVVALRARYAFDARGGEGGQLIDLARWRPDLEPFVAEAAKGRSLRGS